MKYICLLTGTILFMSLMLSSCNDRVLDDDLRIMEADTIEYKILKLTELIIIESIDILEIPTRDPNGQFWDFFFGQSSGPDLAIRLRPTGEEGGLMSEVLRHGSEEQHQDYVMTNDLGSCTSQLEGAQVTSGDLPFQLPMNFEGVLEVIDRDIPGLATNIIINKVMANFRFFPFEYHETRPSIISLSTNGEVCQYILKLKVRWI